MQHDYKVILAKDDSDGRKLEGLLNAGWEIQRSDCQMVATANNYNQEVEGGVFYVLMKFKE